MSTREIQGHVRELYGIEISPDLVSAVTDAVHDEIKAWQSRPLEACYAIVFFDAIRVKFRDEGIVRNKAVYLAIGVRCSRHKEILGLWVEQTEGAKFWLRVMNELKHRATTRRNGGTRQSPGMLPEHSLQSSSKTGSLSMAERPSRKISYSPMTPEIPPNQFG